MAAELDLLHGHCVIAGGKSSWRCLRIRDSTCRRPAASTRFATRKQTPCGRLGCGIRSASFPISVDLPILETGSAPAWRKQIPASAKILLYLGRLHAKKGLVNLLRAWESLADAETGHWHLVISRLGSGRLRRRAPPVGSSARLGQ